MSDAQVRLALLDWYATHSRPLPWREPGTTTWAVFLSEVMSQQTPVERLIPTWQRWLELWPTPAALAAAKRADVIREWGTLGYPRRALWLRDAAEVMCRDFDGQVPESYDDLVRLPGIGDYTASAVCAFALQQRLPVLDTNVRRVLARVFAGIARPASAAPTKAERDLATRLLPRHDAADWSVAVMEFGSITCKASRPDCDRCVVANQCAWRANNYPASEPTKPTPKFAGTDRQVRGKIMALLRENAKPQSFKQIEACWPDEIQRVRCLDTLVADGLVEPVGSKFRLPD